MAQLPLWLGTPPKPPTPPPTPPKPIGANEILEAVLKVGAVVGGALLLWEIYLHATSTPEQRSIRASARAHRRQGATVIADHIGSGMRPPKMNGRIADVVAEYDDVFIVEEHAELLPLGSRIRRRLLSGISFLEGTRIAGMTTKSVGRRHSREQDRDLRRYANRFANVIYEQIVVED